MNSTQCRGMLDDVARRDHATGPQRQQRATRRSVLGYRNLTVLDISQTALALTRQRLGKAASGVPWICADVTALPLATKSFDVWHDRAVFHFLTPDEQRLTYVHPVETAVKPRGHIIVSTFGPEGPKSEADCR